MAQTLLKRPSGGLADQVQRHAKRHAKAEGYATLLERIAAGQGGPEASVYRV